MFFKNHKKLSILLIIFLIITFLIAGAIIFLYEVASITPNAGWGDLFSIAFDKQEMETVNRIEITDGEKVIEISAPAFVDSVVKETMVATDFGCQDSFDIKIVLYCDDTVVRTMYLASSCPHICVYDADSTHWIFSIEGSMPKGYIVLSRELEAMLRGLLA